ncbi:MAG TPA: hypothetical protein VHL11_18305 [Phototrophicaceae bacterium]|jgi:hypothetical protein|nr:hypothetical protein [Phototrophicaceae bacterium]
MTAVAVWDHTPDAGEMLDDRLARGWQPRFTALKTGNQIQGYASCLVKSPDKV